MSSHLRLPSERIEQLRLIAQAKNKSVAELIGDFVRAEVEAGTIPARVPGVEIAKSGPEIVIKANGFEAVVPVDQGPTLADVLRQSGDATPSDPERKKRWIEGAAALNGIRVKRAGNGLKIVSPITGNEFPLSLDVAADVADQIERAAK